MSSDYFFAPDWYLISDVALQEPVDLAAMQFETSASKSESSFVVALPDLLSTEGQETEPDVTVVGSRTFQMNMPSWWQSGAGGLEWTEFSGGGSGGGSAGTSETPPDEAVMEITVAVGRTLTPSEEEALADLKETIKAITAAIADLPDDATLTLPNGADVTGAELKKIWAKTDFVINEPGHHYPNNGGSEAKMHFGEPTISLNIDVMDLYNDYAGGMNYFVAHELGHLTQAGDAYLYGDQRTANDIARALLNGAGLPYYADPGFGYTLSAPLQFSTSSTSTGSGGSGDESGGDGSSDGSGTGGGGYTPRTHE